MNLTFRIRMHQSSEGNTDLLFPLLSSEAVNRPWSRNGLQDLCVHHILPACTCSIPMMECYMVESLLFANVGYLNINYIFPPKIELLDHII